LGGNSTRRLRLDRLREERAGLLRAERLRSDPFEIETVARIPGHGAPGEIVVPPRSPAPRRPRD
jgi:hypothetical protein